MEQANILIVDDDDEIREVVKVLLSSEGYSVAAAGSGGKALEYLSSDDGPRTKLVILDVMMPDMDGYETCKKIRGISNVPILFLTAKSSETDMLKGFMSGGDDYLQKPFSYTELAVRVKALIRRYTSYRGMDEEAAVDDMVLTIGDLVIDKRSMTVRRGRENIELTNTEFGILWILAGNRRKVFSIKEIYENVWNDMYLPTAANTVMVHIKNLREKLGSGDDKPELIRNRWGKGYYIE